MDTTLAPIQIQDEDLEKTIQVLNTRFENPKKSITTLCKEAGLDRRQYYRKLEEGTEIIDILRALILKSKRVELANIASSRHRILQSLISKAMKTRDIDELVKTMEYIDKLEDKLQDDLGARPGLEDAAQEFLRKGPKIVKQESRFASIRVSKDEDGGARLDLYEEHDVIDGYSEDV